MLNFITWYLTLTDGDTAGGSGAGSVPANFYTVQVDPFSGRVVAFRP